MHARYYLDDTNEFGIPSLAGMAFGVATAFGLEPLPFEWRLGVGLAGAIGVTVGLVWLLQRRKSRRLGAEPTGIVVGVIRARRSEQWTGFKRGVTRTTHYVTLESSTKERIELAVLDPETFGTIIVGDAGVAYYRGPFLVSFHRGELAGGAKRPGRASGHPTGTTTRP
jgi:predicted outer membrane lipoprotein